MWAAVVPAQNEAGRITTVLKQLKTIGADLIIPVINGSSDNTLTETEALGWPEIKIIHFTESLGIDIPRVIGASIAKNLKADTTLFVDGDLVGDLQDALTDLCETIAAGGDLALTNCYPSFTGQSQLAQLVLSFRRKLNRVCDLEKKLDVASPSHGPMAVSQKFLQEIPLPALAIPPLGMVLAHLACLEIQLATTIPHFQLGSAIKNEQHAYLIAETIIGDCLEAMCIYRGRTPSRTYLNREFRGYNPYRRWDIMTRYLLTKNNTL
ncbi:MAG: glycosyltransferase family 2 protein [bacterium]|jgi:hypothetical protein